MGKRHEAIGIKQVIRFEWMQKAANLLLAGLDAKTIRHELHESFADRKGNGSEGERSDQTRTFVVNNLMKIWVAPDPELIPFRDASLAFLRENPSMTLAVHWGMISAVYPFWFNVARQTGRLLALQDQVTQTQIINRLKEQYGDRQTIFRYGRYVLRSFVAWGSLKDSGAKGCYEKAAPVSIVDANLAILMLESALLATSEATGALGLLLNNPAFFPFTFPVMTGDFVSQHSERIDVVRYGLDDELLRLKAAKY
ncbi:hypothetical protein ISE59_09985 [Pseudomonas aeruginosa]|uniref:hypothetical protein n=1 Tax=Pseudomonas TaxID=286 RepID=UPI0003B94268|nr:MULTISPECIES: hypothetical protein [Pseudomonas]EIU7179269.1 hypothetical protein [Pseudomonas aeruginosa]ERW31057.1 hypothetical protein Q032_03569 [Pseudomonas aeruginosa BWHPSA019]ERX55321.1 hypothetical protein Q006_02158 [Pseudomonas aeruginosa UDL]KSK41593.1 hypothetical protein APA41_21955 [Pseudomonas aeruginosa]MBG4251746.1 hypothetical protein [Pseudomonas aeruginosa]